MIQNKGEKRFYHLHMSKDKGLLIFILATIIKALVEKIKIPVTLYSANPDFQAQI